MLRIYHHQLIHHIQLILGSTKTVYEEAKSEMTALEDAGKILADTTKVVEDGDYSEEALENLATAQEEFQQLGGYEQEQMVDSVLKGLGFDPEDSERLCSSFSGGWQMRIGKGAQSVDISNSPKSSLI